MCKTFVNYKHFYLDFIDRQFFATQQESFQPKTFKSDIADDIPVSKRGASYPDKENVRAEMHTKKNDRKKKDVVTATTKPSAALEYVRKLRKDNETKVEKRSGKEMFFFYLNKEIK